MKTLKAFLLLVLLLAYKTSTAQLVKTESDAYLLLSNKQMFIDKPLSVLLQQIKPELKGAMAIPSAFNQVRLGHISLYFVNRKSYDSIRLRNKYPLRITVFVKENFEWERTQWQMENRFIWTADDAKKYGNLTVVGLSVFGGMPQVE